MQPDPPIPADGTCANCGADRGFERSRKYGKDAAERDPFCSTHCARAYHGAPSVKSERRNGIGKRPPALSRPRTPT